MELEEWLNNNTLSIDIFNKKYRQNEETLEEWFDRVSGGDLNIKRLIREKKFLFGGRILANRGLKNRKISLNNCYVLPGPEDNIESIYDTAKYMARTFSAGGGVGIDLSNLAPSGAKVNNAAKTTSGAISFGDIYDTTTSLIGSEGRRAALMLSMSCDHPDIDKFITAKSDLNKLTKANLSVRMTDFFMQSATCGWEGDYPLTFTRENGDTTYKNVNPEDIFNLIVKNNWNYGEPGLLFWDRIERWNLLSNHPDFKFAGINPCGEEPLPAYGACCLGSFNVHAYVKKGKNSGKYYFDWDEFKADISLIVQEMDDIIDEGLALHPLKKQRDAVEKWRQIGIGIFGFASTLMMLGIKYGSEESIIFANDMAETLLNESVIASAELAEVYGPYPAYNYEYVKASEFYQKNLSEKAKRMVEKYGLRNSQLLSIAPTGTLSTLLQVSGGIEPLFALSYNRRTESLHGEQVSYEVYDPTIVKIMEESDLSEADLPDYVVTSTDIDPLDRVRMQAAWQRYIDASISSTVNLPESATIVDVGDIYIEAWNQGLKGITVYRSGCAREGILTEEKKPKVHTVITQNFDGSDTVVWHPGDLIRGQWKKKAEDTLYESVKIHTACGKLTLMVGYSESEKALQDFYVIRSGKGGCERTIQSLVIAMSAVIRLGGKLENLEKAFDGVGTCNSFTNARAKNLKELSPGNNCGEAILKAIRTFCQSKLPVPEHTIPKVRVQVLCTLPECPECKAPMAAEGGCFTCKSCGYSKCG